jgi:hypothetical protein
MSKVRDISGLANIIKTDANGNVTFVSGSTTLMAISSSGAVTSTGTIGGSNSATLATTGSNTFTGQQYVSNTNAPVNFTDTASLYTDGGLRVGKDAYVSGTLYLNDLTVYGTQSVNYITSSQLDIADNIITVNTSTPAIRFGGIAVRDSGSAGTGLTGSLLWDSQNNHWVYTNPSGSSYSGGMLISGPRASSLGEEQGTTFNALMKGQGGDHITSSGIFENGLSASFYNNVLVVSASGNVGIGTTPNTTAGITELAIGSSNTNPLISGIRDGVSAFSLSSDSGGTRLLERRNLELTIGTNNTTRLTIASTGAATFSSTVQANGAFRQFATTGYYSDFAYNGTTYNLGSGETTDNIDFKIAGGGAFTSGGNFRWFTQTGGATPIQALKITPSGNLEIGTSSKASFSYLALINDANTNGGVIAIARTAGQFLTAAGAGDMIIGNSTGENILFGNGQTGTTEYMRISSAGNVLIGKTTDDGQRLQVNGAVRTDNVGLIRVSSFRGGLYTYDAVIGSGTDYGITIFAEGGTGNGNIYFCPNGSVTKAMTIATSGAVTILGSLSKGSGSFRIKHPLLSKKDTHQLVHSFIEGPQADLIYRGKVRLNAGKATVNIDEASTMTEGTFEALCREVQCFTTNETSWDAVRGKVEGNILTIESQNTESTDEISWMVIGERQDEHMMDTSWTDENGKVIVEPLILEENN